MAEVSDVRIAVALERIADTLESQETQKYGTVELDGQRVTRARYRAIMKARRTKMMRPAPLDPNT